MIIADTMVWADHISHGDDRLFGLLDSEGTVMHLYVRGELALGNLARRASILADIDTLPVAPLADHREVLSLIESAPLFGSGVGYVDAHLLAATLLLDEGRLWTRDRRLLAVADRLGIAYPAA